MIRLRSSCIYAVDYSPETRSLRVWFHNNGTYTYFGVPLATYVRLLNSSSPGRFLASNIKPYYSRA